MILGTLIEEFFICVRYNIVSVPPFECFDFGTVGDTAEISKWAGDKKDTENPNLMDYCPVVRVVKCRAKELWNNDLNPHCRKEFHHPTGRWTSYD